MRGLRRYVATRAIAEVCGDVVPGVWCDDCALPSVVAIPLVVALVDGRSAVLLLRVAQTCTSCGRETIS